MEPSWDDLTAPDDEPIVYRCAECDAEHRGLPDLAFRLPDDAFAIPEDERPARLRSSNDLCIVDGERHFVRAVLPVPVRETDYEYCFGVWVALEEPDFVRYRELFDEDPPDDEGPYVGSLSNAVPGYDHDVPLATNVHLQPDGKRPRLELKPSGHALAVHQRQGIDLGELLRILKPYIEHADRYSADG
jgi:hypothetical protein